MPISNKHPSPRSKNEIKIGYCKNDFGNKKRVLTEAVGLDYTPSHVPLSPLPFVYTYFLESAVYPPFLPFSGVSSTDSDQEFQGSSESARLVPDKPLTTVPESNCQHTTSSPGTGRGVTRSPLFVIHSVLYVGYYVGDKGVCPHW